MKILLDESIDVSFANLFPEEHEVLSVRGMGWLGIDNGDLLDLAQQAGIQAFVTTDRNMQYQQNPDRLSFPVVVLHAYRNTERELKPFIPRLLRLLGSNTAANFYNLDAP